MMRFRCLLLIGCLCLPLIGRAAPAPQVPTAPLSLEQRQWLAQHPELRVGLVLQAPFAQYDRRLQRLSGANVELMQALAKALNIELSWRNFPDQAQLERALRDGEVDMAPGLAQTPAGLRLWLFSDPYMRVPQLVVGERKGAGAVELEKLDSQARVAVRMPSAVADYLRLTYPNLNLQGVPLERQALQLLLSQQARYAVVDEAQLSRLSGEAEFAGLAVVGDIGLPQLLRVATRRDWPELASIVEAALHAIPAKELEQLHGRWLQPKYPRLGESPGVWQNLSLLLVILLLASLAIVFWQRRQQRSLEHRLLAAREDIALRAASEEALRLTQFSIDQSTVGILWVNWDSHVRYANRAAEEMLGYPAGGVIDRPLIDFEPNLHMDRWLNLWKRARASEEGVQSFETQCVRADGSILPADVSLSFLRFRDSEYLVVYLNDVTERRRALAALRESEARLQGIAANVPGLVFRLERAPVTGQIDFAYISEGSETLVGYSPAVLAHRDKGLRSLVHPDDKASYHQTQDQALDTDSDWSWQGRILTRQGQQRWAEIKAITRRLDDGAFVWDGIVWDISESKRIELELASSREQLRELSAHLESVREEEKARIAREVHDELGQMLTVLKLETSMCELAYAQLDPGLHERLNSMKRLIAQLFQLVRDVATALRPPILDAGIASAIEWQARRFEARTQIPCLVQVPDNLPRLSDAKAVGLFRILQEALTNVMRHAQAHTVELTLTLEAHELCMSISDDGLGFDTASARPTSFGLVGMRERVLIMGGSLSLHSERGEGTTLSVRVPLDQEQ
ncbi:multi-sensor signal transduction histidine kinase [Pseudomonas sp. NFPP10]|uniref:PAS domain-containing sensor histidine kinase n=1 Tax=unclassified Pseudomonas TaxID=196821 RepID=UPI000887951E|nr:MULTISPECIES: sensor histidine kinase [unclassified Pseudomonas]SDA28282.1 multi-sensor signal transduction histidine kinase [Pseudomonas sp. NFPP12]SEM20979.1 multi-sensor signal transduction histidine kinase [Pseudomonas sp. NFPP10]SFJ82000.1 multi-sensor signal transduction histidine kinase [Pseudomonas sp. NFPP08]SFN07989.1 multi-sensor signal transduction histidine kinase [Pseudomonas sp. NFPP05]SFX76733.1 multi-sensor signal transduction histidine kinase [Pseudomonas sp. NFPP09]